MGLESDYQNNKDWSFDGKKVTNRRKCRCGKGEEITYTSTYSHEKVFKPDETFIETVLNCDICNAIDDRFKRRSIEITKEYKEEKKVIYDMNKVAHEELNTYIQENELVKFNVKSKKKLYDLLRTVHPHGFGSESKFYKDYKHYNVSAIVSEIIKERIDDLELLKMLYSLSQEEIPELIMNLINEMKLRKQRLYDINREIREREDQELQAIREEMEV